MPRFHSQGAERECRGGGLFGAGENRATGAEADRHDCRTDISSPDGGHHVVRAAFAAKYPAAWKCLEKDQERLFTLYKFPADRRGHPRTINPIESTFATARLRNVRTMGCSSHSATLSMVFKLAPQAQNHWRKLNSHVLPPKVLRAVRFEDGIEQTQATTNQEIAAQPTPLYPVGNDAVKKPRNTIFDNTSTAPLENPCLVASA